MKTWFRNAIGILLLAVIFIAWADGGPAASDFGRGVGEVTGDVVSAVVDFFHGLSDNRPSTETPPAETTTIP